MRNSQAPLTGACLKEQLGQGIGVKQQTHSSLGHSLVWESPIHVILTLFPILALTKSRFEVMFLLAAELLENSLLKVVFFALACIDLLKHKRTFWHLETFF